MKILIKLFMKWKGEKYMPSKMHPAIWWNKSDPFLESQNSVNGQVVDPKVNALSLLSSLRKVQALFQILLVKSLKNLNMDSTSGPTGHFKNYLGSLYLTENDNCDSYIVGLSLGLHSTISGVNGVPTIDQKIPTDRKLF